MHFMFVMFYHKCVWRGGTRVCVSVCVFVQYAIACLENVYVAKMCETLHKGESDRGYERVVVWVIVRVLGNEERQ